MTDAYEQEQAGVTGHPDVDAALAGLDRLADAPPAEQVDGYEQAHQLLRDTLSTIDRAGQA